MGGEIDVWDGMRRVDPGWCKSHSRGTEARGGRGRGEKKHEGRRRREPKAEDQEKPRPAEAEPSDKSAELAHAEADHPPAADGARAQRRTADKGRSRKWRGGCRKESRKRENAKARKDCNGRRGFAQAAKKWNVCITSDTKREERNRGAGSKQSNGCECSHARAPGIVIHECRFSLHAGPVCRAAVSCVAKHRHPSGRPVAPYAANPF
jgi:hypothetical protein